MTNKYLAKSSEMLLKKSRVVMTDFGCYILWGEPELPEILRKEYESKNEDASALDKNAQGK